MLIRRIFDVGYHSNNQPGRRFASCYYYRAIPKIESFYEPPNLKEQLEDRA